MIDSLLDVNLVTRIRERGDKTQDINTIPNPIIGENGRPKDGAGIRVTPIRRSKEGNNSSHTTQLRCRKCGRKTTNQFR